MNIRKLIREEIRKVLNEEDGSESLFGGAIGNIEAQLQDDLENVTGIINTQQTDLKNKDNEIKADLQLKSKLDAKNPHKMGLEREVPEKQKDYEVRKKQLKNLEDAKKGLITAKAEIEKQKMDMEKSAKSAKPGAAEEIPSVLPTLQSPI